MHRDFERSQTVAAYVRARLRADCQERGRAAEIGKQTGFSAAHLSRVRNGKADVGIDLAHAMAERWGLTYAQLEELARAEHDGAKVSSRLRLPNLEATVAFCRGDRYPDEFLVVYKRRALRHQKDRPRLTWWCDIEVKYWDWQQEQKSKVAEPKRARKGTAERWSLPEEGEATGVISKIRGSDVRNKAG